MRESSIEKAVCSYARAQGWHNFKLSGPGDRGKPDRVFFGTGGRVMFIEFKAPGVKPEPIQDHHLSRIAACDIDCYVIDNITDGQRLFDEQR